MFEIGVRKRGGSFSSAALASMDVRSSIAQDGSRWDIIEDLDLFYFRQLAVSLQDYDMQQKIDLEIKMREGTRKLLVACKREAQTLEAAKNLLTSNVRVLSYMAELQRRKTAQFADRAQSRKGKSAGGGSDSGVEAESGGDLVKPCTATVCISDLQVPLMWRDIDHIRNRGDHHRYAVFCLLKIDTQIHATQLVSNIDRKSTDVVFDDVIVFEDVKPGFSCVLEVYSYNLHNDMTIASTPQKIRRKLNSLSTSVGRRGSVGQRSQANPTTSSSSEEETKEGPKYSLVARTRLSLQDVSDRVQTFNLTLEKDDRTHHQLALFGNVCCRLAAQPTCMTQDSMTGYLSCQDEFQGEPVTSTLWYRLRGSQLAGWDEPADADISEPIKCVQLTKSSSVVRLSDLSSCTETFSFVVTGCHDNEERHVFTAVLEEELECWLKAFEQQLVNIQTWKVACREPMKMYSPYPKRSDLVLAERKGSLYEQLSIVSPDREDFDEENVFQTAMAADLCSRRKTRSQSLASSCASTLASSSSLSSPPLFTFQKPLIPEELSAQSQPSPSTSLSSSLSSTSSSSSSVSFPFQKAALPKETTV